MLTNGAPSSRAGPAARPEMGIGDNIMASGMARGAAARGKRIAFGDGRKIIWDQNSEMIFRGNPNVAEPGEENRGAAIEWLAFHRGNRIYNRQDKGRWIWNYDFRAVPGEVFLSEDEKRFGAKFGSGFVVIEPNVPAFKSVAPNKQWPVERYDIAAKKLRDQGFNLIQFDYGKGCTISGARQVKTPTFRHALAMLSNAALYVGPEGGLHHAAAALAKPAVVLFGGFIPPQVTGYDSHTNLTGGAEACGSLQPCGHCRNAMDAISIDHVYAAAMQHLRSNA